MKSRSTWHFDSARAMTSEMHMTSLVSLVIWTERSGSLIVAATGRPQSVVQGSSLALCSNTC